ncbi:ParM/StbA family protein [Lysinibacillus sp. K60]|uniref:ParM/StbA family protein n=1 Tax=Lysinibacillus sp. K60 TaxID=2720027 RepID=UPI001C8B1D69|nr:ParM/StbA family protein [Lysinibacillus sp. K60]MBX8945896.1 ParM/StbA family protein [Lysinibacillus sp. K60]
MTKKRTKNVVRKAGVDGGNGETKMYFEGVDEGLAIPTAELILLNANSKSKGNFLANDVVTPKNIHEHLDITFLSSKALSKSNERYLIGKRTLKALGAKPKETPKHAQKHTSEIVARTVLAGLLVDAIRNNPESKTITAHYDLNLALPLNQIDEEAFQKHAERFIGTHEMKFHYPNGEEILVTIVVEFAMTLPEGAIGGYAIVYNLDGTPKIYEILEEDENGNQVKTEVTFEDRELLMGDIGAGSLDCAVMFGVDFDYENSEGFELGTKESVNKIRTEWNKLQKQDQINSLTQFTEIYSNTEIFNSAKLQNFSTMYLNDDAIVIADSLKSIYEKMPSRARIVLYGGGAILYKNALIPLLEEYSDKVIFAPDPKFITAKGLLIFALTPAFEEIKNNYLEALSV